MESRDLSGVTIAGKYLVKRRIGAGGMGAVYEGEHVEIGKRVAIKVIEHEHAKSEELAQRFRREARAASAVESEHIVHVFDVGKDPDVGLYMVMEMLSGTDLSTRIEQCGGALPVEEATTIILQTARGLAKAHAAGVVHRDLKPANLFLTRREDGSACVKILDFGISKLVRRDADTAASSKLTREGTVIGTPQYMSPEQAQGLTVDARSDVWSLGAVAYEVFSGQSLFQARDTYEQMIVQIVTTKPPSLAQIAPRVPREIAAAVDAALARDLDARLADGGAFARRLADAARMPASSHPDLAMAATALAMPSPDPAPSSSRTADAPAKTNEGVVVQTSAPAGGAKNRTMLFAVAAVGAVAMVALVVVVGFGKKDDAPKPMIGMVAAAPADPPSAASSAGTPTTKLSPLDAPLEPPVTPSAVASVKEAVPKTVPKPDAKPAAKAPGKPPSGSNQYGAPGVSTVY